MTDAHQVGADNALTWAIRGSFLRYVTVIAGGSFDVTGGVTVDGEGVFTFPLQRVVAEGEDWRLSFAGSVHFLAHHGLLDVLIKDPEIVVGPDGGVLATHTDADPDELLGVVALGATTAARSGAVLTWAPIPSTLAASAVDLFGTVYPAGAEMAPIGIHVTLDS